MTRRLFLLPGLAATIFFGLLVTCATNAFGTQLVGDGSAWTQTIAMHSPGPAGPPIAVRFEPCPGIVAGGCWTPWDSTIYVSASTEREFIYAHELGHAFDTRNLSDRERAWFLAVFGYDQATVWAPDRPVDDPYCLHMRCPVEIFANVYALCALGLRFHAYYDHGDALFWGVHAKLSYYGYGMHLEASVLKQSCRAITTFKDPTS